MNLELDQASILKSSSISRIFGYFIKFFSPSNYFGSKFYILIFIVNFVLMLPYNYVCPSKII